ncbi:unnamed protein product [Vitrella brassicaformis CCMP3155]|uniref:DNA-directed RNA polymerase III subunit RPC9 n=1 Tax=Vitrella brassicaformis (strain CCMP3155) TaxID=1169540 RepID=A0A0G4FU23_VITBC|nr:unnamed protein product [Vitrella brassicaformis CCMP3155]|eukprot:CEM18464.1 unnamed protein product [Vitrella brassicaformis CCMP3155]
MKVVDSNAGNLTNVEVAELLRESLAKAADAHTTLADISDDELRARTLHQGVVDHIERLPCGRFRVSDAEALTGELIGRFDLAEADVLQIINHAPTREVELQMVVESLYERFSAEDIAELLQMVQKHVSSAAGPTSSGSTGKPTGGTLVVTE